MALPREVERGNAPLAPGAVLMSKFRIQRVLGQGGMGVVYAAHHIFLDRPVAIKLLAQHAAMNPEALARFLNEARNAARIDHEYVCRVMDLGVLPDGQPYIAMELLDGVDLGTLLATRGPLPPVEAVGYVIQALTGIGEAHLKGVIHRDLKPSNLFLAKKADGRPIVKVLDFGISKAVGVVGARALTSMNNLVGSPAYMSPEQVKSSATIDGRADLWAVGVILYELLTGALPFGSERVAEVLAFILEKDPVPLASRRHDLPPGLEAVIASCLEKDVARRIPSAAALALALAPYGPWAAAGPVVGALPDAARWPEQGGRAAAPSLPSLPAARTPSTWTHKPAAGAARPGSRYPTMVALGVLIGAVFVAVGWLVLSRQDQARAVAARAPAATVSAAPPVPTASVAPTAPAVPVATAAPTASAAPEPSATATASATASATAAPAPSVRRRPALSRQRN